MDEILQKLQRSTFRARFKLKDSDKDYIIKKGWDVVQKHAEDFVASRLAPAQPRNDGKQTPMRGHPVFIAQHATACCCRGCLEKWHGFARGRELTKSQQEWIVSLIMTWLHNQMEK